MTVSAIRFQMFPVCDRIWVSFFVCHPKNVPMGSVSTCRFSDPKAIRVDPTDNGAIKVCSCQRIQCVIHHVTGSEERRDQLAVHWIQ